MVARRWIVGFLLLVFLAASRFCALSEKPYHHDESLYAVYSWRYATQGEYHFDPMLHGPLLYHLQAALFEVLPIDDLTGRIGVATLGFLFPFLGLWFVGTRCASSGLSWLALVSVSPIFCYFSRFLGMDVLLVTLALAWLIFARKVWQGSGFHYTYLFLAFLSLMACTKLNFLFYVFFLLTFPFFLWGDPVFKIKLRRLLWPRK